MSATEVSEKMAKYKTRLQELREARGLSRMDIVRGANLSYPTVVSLETEGVASIKATTEYNLLRLLGVTRDELVYIVPDETDDQ